MRGTQRETNPVRLNVAKVHVPLSAVLAAWVSRKLSQGLVWLLRLIIHRPVVLVPMGVMWFAVRLAHGHGVVVTSILTMVTTAALVVWRWRWPDSFTRHVVWRLRGLWRGWVVYRFAWQPAMVTTNLAVTMDSCGYVPENDPGLVDRDGGPGLGADAARPGLRRLDRRRTPPGADLRSTRLPGPNHQTPPPARTVVPRRRPPHHTRRPVAGRDRQRWRTGSDVSAGGVV